MPPSFFLPPLPVDLAKRASALLKSERLVRVESASSFRCRQRQQPRLLRTLNQAIARNAHGPNPDIDRALVHETVRLIVGRTPAFKPIAVKRADDGYDPQETLRLPAARHWFDEKQTASQSATSVAFGVASSTEVTKSSCQTRTQGGSDFPQAVRPISLSRALRQARLGPIPTSICNIDLRS